MTRWVVAVAALAALASDARGEDAVDESFLGQLWTSIDAQLDRAIAENRRKPPQPVKVAWKKQRLGTVDLGAPVLDVAARDLDGDGKDELIAITTTHVAVLRKAGHRRVKEVARVALPERPASIRSRAPVGVLSIAAGGKIRARASDQSEGVVISFDGTSLAVIDKLAGWPLCEDGTAELRAGHAVFGEDSVAWTVDDSHRSIDVDFLSTSCGSGLVDPAGHALEMFGFVDVDDKLVVRCHSDTGTCGAPETIYDDVGYAFDIADIDNDGQPEVITTSNNPYAGLVDRVTILNGTDKKFTRKFGGGVVAVTAGDVDADGVREVVAVVRLAGATRVNLWTLN